MTWATSEKTIGVNCTRECGTTGHNQRCRVDSSARRNLDDHVPRGKLFRRRPVERVDLAGHRALLPAAQIDKRQNRDVGVEIAFDLDAGIRSINPDSNLVTWSWNIPLNGQSPCLAPDVVLERSTPTLPIVREQAAKPLFSYIFNAYFPNEKAGFTELKSVFPATAEVPF